MKKNIFMKIAGLALIVILALGCLTGCGQKLPETTSQEAGLYVYGSDVLDALGEVAQGYTIDEDGNILNSDGDVVVAAASVAVFTVLGELSVPDAGQLKQTMEAELLENEQLATSPVKFTVTIHADAQDIVNSTIVVETDDTALYFPYEDNKELLADAFTQAPDEPITAITLKPAGNEDIDLVLEGAFEGEYNLTVKNVLGSDIAKFPISVVAKVVEKDEDAEDEEDHVHDYEEKVVAATTKSQGYTIYTCKICGLSYRDNFTDKLPCNHVYKDKVVAPTYTSTGYTLHTCTLCGYSYKDNETAKLVCSHSNVTKTKVDPTCTEGGYTLSKCNICHEEWKDSETAALGHNYDGGKVSVEATCGTTGTRIYTCRRCGETRSETIAATGKHGSTHTQVSVAATCTKEGIMLNVCDVCGKSISSTSIPATGHSSTLNWVTVTEATCGSNGLKNGCCTTCGAVIQTESIPATGNHSYVTNTVEPSCTTGGYTEDVCSVCGSRHESNITSALGHDWEERTEQKQVGSEVHTFCGECGMDLTANGISGAAVEAHAKAHVMAGGGGRTCEASVPIYQTVTFNVCRRCGATE